MKDLLIVHDDNYKGWVFDPTHVTQGRRFLLGKDMIVARAQAEMVAYEVVEPDAGKVTDLLSVHTAAYVSRVITEGLSGEWVGSRPDLSALALEFVGGTMRALHALDIGEALTAVHLPGAKHHAQADYSSGFCVFADFAIAAKAAVEWGHRVAILDIDAHHGDGTEALLLDNPNVLTFSVHEDGIFPGTGLTDDVEHFAWNYPLGRWSGDRELREAVAYFIRLAEWFEPTMIFVVAGADGHITDPLSSLRYSVDGYGAAARAVRRSFPHMPVLMGGAGGYTPDGATPLVWAEVALSLSQPGVW